MDAGTAGIIGSISGALIGALITWRAAVSVLRKQEKYKAGAGFISEFIEIQRLLEIRHPNHSKEYQSTYDLLRDNYVKLSKAVLLYKQSLSMSDANKLTHKWHEICDFDTTHQTPTFERCKITDSSHEKEKRIRDTTLSRIHNLLEIAKVK